MTELLSNDDDVRKGAIKTLKSQASDTPDLVVPRFPELLGYINATEDDFTALQIATSLVSVMNTKPEVVQTYEQDIMKSLEQLGTKPIDDSNNWEAVMMQLFAKLQPTFQSNPAKVSKYLPTLLNLTKIDANIRWSASAPITTIAMQNPDILKDHVRDIFDIMKTGFTSFSSSLLNLYKFDPEAFQDNLDYLFQMYREDATYRSMALNLIQNIAKNDASLLEKEHLDELRQGLRNPSLASLVIMIFEHVAGEHCEYLHDCVQDLHQAVKFNDNLIYQVPNILGLIARSDPDQVIDILTILDELLNNAPDAAKAMIIGEFRNIAEMDTKLVQPYIEKIRGYEDSNQEYVRDQAKMFINFIEGKDVRSLASKIDENNAKIKAAASSTEELMSYIDQNISMIKEFIADITKKLPTQRRFSTEGRIRKTIILHFVCDDEDDRCLFPEDRSFTTETKSWNKWLKIAFSGIKLGKSIITPGAIGNAAKAVKQAYDAYKNDGDEDFLGYISQPFLTSTEQDMLVEQLRDAKYFDVFHYDAQTAGWVCTMCNL